jgi:excisionase family DNA binding protein
MTVQDAAAELGISEQRVRQLCAAGRLGRKVGNFWIITREELDAFKALDRPHHRPPKAD